MLSGELTDTQMQILRELVERVKADKVELPFQLHGYQDGYRLRPKKGESFKLEVFLSDFQTLDDFGLISLKPLRNSHHVFIRRQGYIAVDKDFCIPVQTSA